MLPKVVKYLVISCLLFLFVNYSAGQDSEWIAVPKKTEPKIAKIIHGINAGEGEHPYMIQIRYQNVHACGGTLLTPSCVLTATHCVHGMLDGDFEVRAGGTHRFNNGLAPHGRSKVVDRATLPGFKHIKYPFNITSDVAILRLESPLEGENIKPVELDFETTVKVGDIVTAAGWGDTYSEDFEWYGPIDLQATNITVISQKECQLYIPSPEETFCAKGISNEGVCGGDSGGPAMRNGKQVGILSYGGARCNPNSFVRIANPKVAKFLQFHKKYFCSNHVLLPE